MAVANSAMLQSGGIISRVAAGAGLATLGMGIMSLRAAGNFQESMHILQAVSQASTKQMTAMRKESIALGADMKLPNVSARDAANAMQELAKGGLSVNQILGATRGTLQLGLAANLGFADSATLVARALKAFDLAGTDATKVADLFTAAANKSTAEIGDVALGFQQASARFASTGQTIEDLATSIAIMADAGVVGSDAGTSLKTMMNRLVAPTKKAKDLMDELGLSVYNQAGAVRPMPALIDQMNRATKGMSEEQRNAALYTIFGSDAIRAATIVMGEGSKGFLNYRDSITKGGEAQAFAEARTKGFNGAIQALGSQIETLAIELGTALLPAATDVARALGDFVAGLDPQKIINFFSTIKDAVVWVKDLVQGSVPLQAALVGILAGFVAFKVVTGIIGAVTGAMALLNLVMAANPIVLVGAALIGLGAALVYAYKHSETFRRIVDAAFSWIQDHVFPIVERMAKFIRDNWDEILAGAKAVFNPLRNFIRTVWAGINGDTSTLVGAMANIVRTTLGIIFSVFRTTFNIIQNLFKVFASVLQGDWGAAWSNLRTLATTALSDMAAVIVSILTQLGPAVLTLALRIGEVLWEGIWLGIQEINELGNELIMLMTSAITAAASWALGAAASIGRAIGQGVINGITGMARSVAGAAADLGRGAVSAMGNVIGWGSPAKVFIKMGADSARGYILGLEGYDLPKKVSDAVKKAIEAAKLAAQAAQSKFSEAFSRMGQMAMRAFDAATARFKTPTEKIIEKMTSSRERTRLKQAVADTKKELEDALKIGGVDPGRMAGLTQDWRDANNELLSLLTPSPDRIAEAERARQRAKNDLLKFQEELVAGPAGLSEERKAYWEDIDNQIRLDELSRSFEEAKEEYEKSLVPDPSATDAARAKIAAALAAIREEEAAGQQRIVELRQAHEEALREQQDYFLQLRAEKERTEYEERRAIQRQNLEDQLADLEAYLLKHPEKWSTAQDKVLKVLAAYGITYRTSAQNIAKAFAQGLRDQVGDVEAAAKEIADIVANYLRTRSPAKKGPFASLDTWWAGLVPALLTGLDTRALSGVSSSLSRGYAGSDLSTGMGAGNARATIVNIHNPLLLDRKNLRDLGSMLEPYIGGRPTVTVTG